VSSRKSLPPILPQNDSSFLFSRNTKPQFPATTARYPPPQDCLKQFSWFLLEIALFPERELRKNLPAMPADDAVYQAGSIS
jgi:hypothetical protein